MSANHKLPKTRCRCIRCNAWRAGYEAAADFFRSESGLPRLLGIVRADGLVLQSFVWGAARARTFSELMKEAPTYGELLWRDAAMKGGGDGH